MATRSMVLWSVVVAVMSPLAWAADTGEVAAHMGPTAAVAAVATTASSAVPVRDESRKIFTPSVSAKLSRGIRETIDEGYQLAVERVRDVPECRGMFAELGADGEDALATLVFLPNKRAAAKANECRRGTAYTLVGGGPIWVCRSFSRLSERKAAMVIIHEALHHAGLGEYPRDPDGMNSAVINQMVTTRCGL